MATLQQKIMRRVWTIFFVRQVTSPMALRAYALAFVGWQTAVWVSVRQVLANAPSVFDFGHVFSFYKSAFLFTEFRVQLALIALIALVFSFGRQGAAMIQRARLRTEGSFA